jgi:hypothetical protein
MNRLKNHLSFAFILAMLIGFSVTLTSCGSDDDPPKTTPQEEPGTGSPFEEEYLKIDGKTYSADDISRKILKPNNREDLLEVQFSGGEFIEVNHERAEGDSLIPRMYNPNLGSTTDEDFGYEVSFHYAEGPPPNSCQFFPQIELVENGTYELMKINGKYVSKFSNVKLYCNNDGLSGEVLAEGYLIWEDVE